MKWLETFENTSGRRFSPRIASFKQTIEFRNKTDGFSYAQNGGIVFYALDLSYDRFTNRHHSDQASNRFKNLTLY